MWDILGAIHSSISGEGLNFFTNVEGGFAFQHVEKDVDGGFVCFEVSTGTDGKVYYFTFRMYVELYSMQAVHVQNRLEVFVSATVH